MNIFKFLTGKRGGIRWSSVGLLAAGTVMALSTGPLVKEASQPLPPDRTVFAGSAEEQLASIRNNYIGGQDSFTNEQGIRFTQKGANAGDGLPDFSRGVNSAIAGNAYATKQGVGFVSGADNVDEVSPTGGLQIDTSNPISADNVRAAGQQGGGGAYGTDGAAGGKGAGGGTATNTLSRASVATAGGNSSPVNNGAYKGGKDGSGGNPKDGKTNVPPKTNPELSGKMPNNDSVVLLASTTNKSRFGTQDGSDGGKLRRANVVGAQLERTYRYTKTVADSNNEVLTGVEDFLANDDTNYGNENDNSGGDTGNSDPTLTDFTPPVVTPNDVNKVDDWAEREKAHQRELVKARKHLAINLLIMLGVGLAAGISVYFLMKQSTLYSKAAALAAKMAAAASPMMAPYFTAVAQALAAKAKILQTISIVTMALFSAYAGAMVAQCIRFGTKWSGEAGSLPITGMVVSAAAALGVGIAYRKGKGLSIPSGTVASFVKGEIVNRTGSGIADLKAAASANPDDPSAK